MLAAKQERRCSPNQDADGDLLEEVFSNYDYEMAMDNYLQQ